MKIKAAIFDLDGTLIDSMPAWQGIGEEYLRGLGIEPLENLDETLKTFTFEQSATFFREHYGVALSVEDVVSGLEKVIEKRYVTDIPLKSGVRELLERFAADGVKMCVATSANRKHAESALRRLGVLDHFSEVFVCGELGCDKTEPTVYRLALERMGTKKEETVVFEDACHAIVTARNDGFPTVGVFDAFETEQSKIKSTADYYITDFSDLRY